MDLLIDVEKSLACVKLGKSQIFDVSSSNVWEAVVRRAPYERVHQRTSEHTVNVPVLQMVEKSAEVMVFVEELKIVPQDRGRHRSCRICLRVRGASHERSALQELILQVETENETVREETAELLKQMIVKSLP